MVQFTRLIAILILFLISEKTSGQSDCELRKDRDSIMVYTCKTSGSKFKMVKAQFKVNATYTEVASLLLDIENFTQWQYKTSYANVLKQISENELIYYAVVEAPWPVSNRDVVIRMKITQDPLTRWVTVEGNSQPDYIDKKDNLVRVPASHSTWTLKALSSSQLMAEYSIQIDPGGSVPAWLINIFAADGPSESFRSFRKVIHQNRAKVGFITDYN